MPKNWRELVSNFTSKLKLDVAHSCYSYFRKGPRCNDSDTTDILE